MNAPRTRIISRTFRKPATAATPSRAIAVDAIRLAIVYRDPSGLKAAGRRLRVAGRGAIDQLAANIQRFGVLVPVLIKPDGTILHGHLIVEAAKAIGLAVVPTISVDHLTPAEESTVRISLNRLQELSTWDKAALKTEIEIITDLDLDLVGFTGFTTPQIDIILSPDASREDPDDRLPTPIADPVTMSGDLWLFQGGHRLLCADAREHSSFAKLMGGELASLAACDLPYNVPVRGHVSGRQGAREFAMASGEMSEEAFTAFLAVIFGNLSAFTLDGSLHLHFMDWRHMGEMMAAGHAVYDELKNVCVWAKDNAGMGALWRSQHELCFVWKKGTAGHVNNVELGRHGRNRSNLWCYPGAAGAGRADDDAHPTAKCVAMIADAIMDVTRIGDIVLDPTVGAGTTLVAAHRRKRRGYGIEIDARYVDTAVRRLEAVTGGPARHADTGATFAETARLRAASRPAMQLAADQAASASVPA